MKYAFISILLLISSMELAIAHGEISFPPQSAGALTGHYLDELPKSSEAGQFTQPLISDKTQALHFRRADKKEFVMLVQGDVSSQREKIVAAFEVPKHSEDEFVSFNCGFKKDGKIEPGSGLVGLLKSEKSSGLYQPKIAWKPDLRKGDFRKINFKNVACELRGAD